MANLSEKGVAQVILLILLVVGLVAGVWLVQYGRTVLKPQASESEPSEFLANRECSGEYIICEDTWAGRRATLVRESTTLRSGETSNECTKFMTDIGDCDNYFCPDNKCYFDDKVNRWVHKHGGYEENRKCTYDFTSYETKNECEVGRKKEADDRFYNIGPAFKNNDNYVCQANEYNKDYCTRCNSTGDGIDQYGSDWGRLDQDPGQWCKCASQYSYSLQEKAYTKENYPQCF